MAPEDPECGSVLSLRSHSEIHIGFVTDVKEVSSWSVTRLVTRLGKKEKNQNFSEPVSPSGPKRPLRVKTLA